MQGRGRVDLNWVAPAWAVDGYHISRSTDGGVTFALHATVNDPNAAHWYEDGLADGTKYVYRIRTFTNAAGDSMTTNKVWTVTNLPGPGTASVSLLGPDFAILHWTDNTAAENGFEIVRVNPDNSETTFHVGTNATSVRASGLTPDTTYGFRVRAANDVQQSIWSPTLSVTTLPADVPAAPTDLIASYNDDGNGATLRWRDNSDNESGFTIERQDGSGVWSIIGTVGADVTTFADADVTDHDIAGGQAFDATYRVMGNGARAVPGAPGGAAASSPSNSSQAAHEPGGDRMHVYGDVPPIPTYVKSEWSPLNDSGDVDDEGNPIMYAGGYENEPVTLKLSHLPRHTYGIIWMRYGISGLN